MIFEEDYFYATEKVTGKNVLMQLLFTFECEENGKNYVVYTQDTRYRDKDEETILVYASTYNPDENDRSLGPIETEYEWSMLEIILDELKKETQILSSKAKVENELEDEDYCNYKSIIDTEMVSNIEKRIEHLKTQNEEL